MLPFLALMSIASWPKNFPFPSREEETLPVAGSVFVMFTSPLITKYSSLPKSPSYIMYVPGNASWGTITRIIS